MGEAAHLVRANSVRGFADIPDDAGLPLGRVAWAEAAAIVGERDACRAMIDQLEPQQDIFQITGAWYAGSTARYLAILSAALGDDEAGPTTGSWRPSGTTCGPILLLGWHGPESTGPNFSSHEAIEAGRESSLDLPSTWPATWT